LKKEVLKTFSSIRFEPPPQPLLGKEGQQKSLPLPRGGQSLPSNDSIEGGVISVELHIYFASIILKEKQIMDRNYQKTFFRVVITALLAAGLGMLAGCGGGGGGGAVNPGPTLKSGDVVWVQTVDPTVTYDDEIYGVAVDGAAVYAVGFDSKTTPTYDDQWRIEKRNLTNGALVSSFGSSGVVVKAPG
jgi:hypothetical protein